MRFQVDWNQPSTVRGAIWLVTSLVAGVGYFALGKDVTPILLIGTTVVGGLGYGVKDHDSQPKD